MMMTPPPNLPWSQIRASTADRDIEWHNCPSQSQWYNGNAEAAIKMLKKTLKHLTKSGDITHEDLQTLLGKAANVINERPIDCRRHSGAEPAVCPITPNLLMLGYRANTGDLSASVGRRSQTENMQYLEQVFLAWWDQWYASVFDKLIPVAKWREEKRNCKPGDIVLVRFQGGMGPGEYRLAIVRRVKVDEKGLVRTVVVACRPRDKREPSLPYKSKDLWEFSTSVHRVVLLIPADERPELFANTVHSPADAVATDDTIATPNVATDDAIATPSVAKDDPRVDMTPLAEATDVTTVVNADNLATDVATDGPLTRAMRKKMVDHGMPVSPLKAMPVVHLCPEIDLSSVDPSTVSKYPLFTSPSMAPVLNNFSIFS